MCRKTATGDLDAACYRASLATHTDAASLSDFVTVLHSMCLCAYAQLWMDRVRASSAIVLCAAVTASVSAVQRAPSTRRATTISMTSATRLPAKYKR